MKDISKKLDHIKHIEYQIGQNVYLIKPSNDTIAISIENLTIRKRYTANACNILPLSNTHPSYLYDCFLNQFIIDRKQPKLMLAVDSTQQPTILVRFNYTNAPLQTLRLPCQVEHTQNPHLQPFKDAISNMIETAMQHALKKYQPTIEQYSNKCIQKIRAETEHSIARLSQLREEILGLNKELYQEIVFEIKDGIKQYKEHLEGNTQQCIQELRANHHKLIKEIAVRTACVEKELVQCQQNQMQLHSKWQDVETELIQHVDQIDDELERLSDQLTRKLETKDVEFLLEKHQLIKPPKIVQHNTPHQEHSLSVEDLSDYIQTAKLSFETMIEGEIADWTSDAKTEKTGILAKACNLI